MQLDHARAVLEADRTGDRTGFHFGHILDGAGTARHGWGICNPATNRYRWLGKTWEAVVAAARAELATDERDAEIASAIASGASAADAVADHGLTPARGRQIALAAGVEPRRAGRPARSLTGNSTRGRALLAQLVADAAAAGFEPEVYLDGARAWYQHEQ